VPAVSAVPVEATPGKPKRATLLHRSKPPACLPTRRPTIHTRLSLLRLPTTAHRLAHRRPQQQSTPQASAAGRAREGMSGCLSCLPCPVTELWRTQPRASSPLNSLHQQHHSLKRRGGGGNGRVWRSKEMNQGNQGKQKLVGLLRELPCADWLR
jgi:hypothetical protein